MKLITLFPDDMFASLCGYVFPIVTPYTLMKVSREFREKITGNREPWLRILRESYHVEVGENVDLPELRRLLAKRMTQPWRDIVPDQYLDFQQAIRQGEEPLTMDLRSISSLRALPEPIDPLESRLDRLNLEHCTSLTTLPASIYLTLHVPYH